MLLTSVLLAIASISSFPSLVGAVPHNRLHSRQGTSYVNFINDTRNNAAHVELKISTLGGGRNATAPLLYGWMFEDISVCIPTCSGMLYLTEVLLAFWGRRTLC